MTVFICSTVRPQAGIIVIALRLSIVVITHAVKEDHQNGPSHEEQDHRAERINLHTDLQPGIHRWNPIYRRTERGFSKIRRADGAHKNDHRTQP